MTAARRHLLLASGILTLLGVLTGLFVFSGSPTTPVPAPGQSPSAAEAPRLTAADKATLSFFKTASGGASKDNRSLFATDFFKPPPAPKAATVKVAPPPPPVVSIVYRGFADLSGGARIAYLGVDGDTVAFASGDAVADKWTLDTFDSAEAVLVRDAQRVTLPFNESTPLPSAPSPAAHKK